ncbi:hypothetical protein [Rathayibacter tritici]|uniref:hypothetical protein n=1 Tax=Rathayibacter tritici TaxID=33888 RepID=UPI001AD7F64E|nr:hypothetical protein [Rathayibacter tritici]
MLIEDLQVVAVHQQRYILHPLAVRGPDATSARIMPRRLNANVPELLKRADSSRVLML